VRFIKKWSAELQKKHEERAETMDAIHRAMARAEAFADECRSNLRPIPRSRARRKLNADDQASIYRERERELKEAYAAEGASRPG
jgi:geranylgeranyl pyrophosphate synthase